MDYKPTKLDVSKEQLSQARQLLAENKVIIRYLRTSPTVGLKWVPIRDKAGKILEDLPPKRVQVICHGTPVACLTAVIVDGALRIGWSRRLDTKALLATQPLYDLFESVIEDVQGLKPESENYEEAFQTFCKAIIRTLSDVPTKDHELSFSKDAGRTAATIRALLDDIIIVNKKVMKSDASGPIPNDVARGLRKFIPQVEEKFGKTAENVTKDDGAAAAAS